MVSLFEGRNHFKPERSISKTHRTPMDYKEIDNVSKNMLFLKKSWKQREV